MQCSACCFLRRDPGSELGDCLVEAGYCTRCKTTLREVINYDSANSTEDHVHRIGGVFAHDW